LIFRQGEHDPVLLKIFVGDIQLNCHFFSPDEIELDPVEVASPEDQQRVLDFIHQLGRTLDRPVVLTGENQPDMESYRFEP
jgi:hypothetical protein